MFTSSNRDLALFWPYRQVCEESTAAAGRLPLFSKLLEKHKTSKKILLKGCLLVELAGYTLKKTLWKFWYIQIYGLQHCPFPATKSRRLPTRLKVTGLHTTAAAGIGGSGRHRRRRQLGGEGNAGRFTDFCGLEQKKRKKLRCKDFIMISCIFHSIYSIIFLKKVCTRENAKAEGLLRPSAAKLLANGRFLSLGDPKGEFPVRGVPALAYAPDVEGSLRSFSPKTQFESLCHGFWMVLDGFI